MTVHSVLAAIVRAPELELDASEASKIAVALQRVSRHYPILDRFGDKAIDHANLMTLLAGTYGTRIFAIMARRTAERAKPTQSASATVTPIRPHAGPGFTGV